MTTVLVATTGGHLTQLHRLASRIDIVDDDRVWITHENPQSRSLLAGERVEFVPHIAERDLAGVARSMRHARTLFRSLRPSGIVSTGSAIAVGYLAVAASRGVPAYYIESAARSGSASLTGRILHRFPRVKTFTQYPARTTRGWHHAGSVFDDFEPIDAKALDTDQLSVVVTIGSTDWPFDRLLRHIEEIAPSDASICWQVGTHDNMSLPGEVFAYLHADELSKRMANADAVIAHAGCGSALSALTAGRVPVLVSREASHGEIADDHQPQLGEHLAQRGLALHRSVEQLTWADVVESARRGVRTIAEGSVLRLAT